MSFSKDCEAVVIGCEVGAGRIDRIRQQVGATGSIKICEVYDKSELSSASCDHVSFTTPIDLLQINFEHILTTLRPSGTVCIDCLATTEPSLDKVKSVMTLNGFVNVTVTTYSCNNKEAVLNQLKLSEPSTAVLLCSVEASKPAYEIGASVPLKLLPKKADVIKAWTLSANDIMDDDILDSDVVLDADDLQKPDPASLKAPCGVEAIDASIKRKACKNCTCGLAEELAAENAKADTSTAKSSCGSCYLGDAFRCSSCPYRGLPAFKPGEKIQIPVTDDL